MTARIALIALAAISISLPAMADKPLPTTTSTSCGPVYCCTTVKTPGTVVVTCVPRAKAATVAPSTLFGRD